MQLCPDTRDASEISSRVIPALRNAGSLQDCTWRLLGDSASWEVEHRQGQEEDDSGVDAAQVTADNARGIHIQLHYEKSTYTAMLLRHPSTKSAWSSKEFTSFPLLLTRMPTPLRELILEYLTTTFDTHVSPMRLRSDFLSTSLEQLLGHFPSAQSTQRASSVVKAVQIQLAFPSAAPLLKNLDITLSADDVARFVQHGERLQAANSNTQQQEFASRPSVHGPFTAALSHYLHAHLALSFSHPGVRISKIACGAFALSADGKMKIFPPVLLPTDDDNDNNETAPAPSPSESGMQQFCASLLHEAAGSSRALISPKDRKRILTLDGADAPEASKRPSPRKRQKQRDATEELIPVDPPPPYELHDPASFLTL
ncbi:hypothetical protein B0A49_00473 [Cryomyces minteri]|uniref:Uncharacterized protein n=1 Tax=Cryomyces minteri TaxID=331657 RepID=A0A4U0Y0X8_9PEZI|nr:hypothetical protein B0A49_00473 [Cryomyces minteri]